MEDNNYQAGTTFVQEIWQNFANFIEPFLNNLDPSLFQNVIFGVLMVFVPFAIVLLTDVLGGTKEQSEFEKLVLYDEIFDTIKFFLWSAIGIFFFSFFGDGKVSTSVKIFSIILIIIIFLKISKPFFKIRDFARGNKKRYKLSFLRKLKFSKILFLKNKQRGETMWISWGSIWKSKLLYFGEKDFTDIFISHIDNAIKFKRFQTAVGMAQTYVDSIENRQSLWVGADVLPKVLEWSERFWEEEQIYSKNYDNSKKILDWFGKNFPTFQKWIKKINTLNRFARILARKIYRLFAGTEYLGGWNYFQDIFFKKVFDFLIQSGNDSHKLFKGFEKFVKKCEDRLSGLKEKAEEAKTKSDQDNFRRYGDYFIDLISVFSQSFFDSEASSNRYNIRHRYFPNEWKVTKSNLENPKNYTVRILLNEFLRWSTPRIESFDFDVKDQKLDKKLDEVARDLFPETDPRLFAKLLIMFFVPQTPDEEMKSAIEWNWNFGKIGRLNFGITSLNYMSDEELYKRDREKLKTQEQKTIELIFTIFSENEMLQKENLEKYKQELKNLEKEYKEDDNLEKKRVRILYLVNQLLNYLKK